MNTKRIYEKKIINNWKNILRRIFRPTKDRDGTWRIKTNAELNNLIRNADIIDYIKAQTLRRLGHIKRMTNDRVVKKILWIGNDIYNIGMNTKHWLGKQYNRIFKNCENK